MQRLDAIRNEREKAFVAPTAKSAALKVNDEEDSETDDAAIEALLAAGTGKGLVHRSGGRNRKSKKHYKNKKNKTKKRIF